ncbi:MAG: cryptochrome/photolyase family protein [Acidiferrobacterales bacterium]|nr:cryptochrome/photolyase family protein [Acidiferrobacterales bacterium]
MPTKTLRLILGDQLNAAHSWFQKKQDDVLYVVAELHQETNYVKHHIQKIAAFFSAMNAFSQALEKAGHRVLHLSLSETQAHKDLPSLIDSLSKQYKIDHFEYQRPDEFRLKSQLEPMELEGVTITSFDSEHFLVPFVEIDDYFKQGKANRMETFYRKMRRRFDILMDGDEPFGGQWNYDKENRKKIKQSELAEIPSPLIFENKLDNLIERLNDQNVTHFGNIGDSLLWPTTRQQALDLLEYFCQHCLPKFGLFQDAMTANSDHAWSLYHSRLSFALNAKILHPLHVVERAVKEFNSRPDEISIAQIEGFVRQIIGWREFVRGIYWINMPTYADSNYLRAQRDLPDFFWNGKTKMHCMQRSIGQSLDYAYAHHIQRLMVIGNFCLLAGIDPDQVDEWYLGVYIDAIEWVEMPNTRGMSQFADGGIIASKPYTASGAYINRMSDYCKDCHYKVTEKVGENACPFNSLYWNFMDQHKDKFANNPRNAMVYRNFERMDSKEKSQILKHAAKLLVEIETL